MDTHFLYYNFMKCKILSIIRYFFALTLIFMLIFTNLSFAKSVKDEQYRIDTLITLKIIEDGGNLDSNVTRAEFAKIIVRASENNKKVADNISEAVCNDVNIDTPYAAYIKNTLENAYMFTYLGGFFKPYDFVSFSDLSRACLSLLSYKNEDFRGNQVVGRNNKFRSLKLDENIDKNDTDLVTKRDIINAIYNTLNEKIKDSEDIYGKIIFDKLIIDGDKEINAYEYKSKNVNGPYFAKNVDELSVPFEINDNIYINAIKYSFNDLKEDISNYGYAIYYLDLDNKMVCAYTERQDVSAPIVVRKGFVYKIYYAASNMLTPYRVDIGNYKYMLDSEEVKFAFSANGMFKEDDYIIYLCNKMNDITSAYIDTSGNIAYSNDESEPYNGSIIVAYSANSIK